MKNFLDKYSKKPDSLFQRLFFGFLFGLLPFTILFIILSLIGVEPVNFNGKEYYGFSGALILIVATPVSAITFTVFIYVYLMIGHLVLKSLNKVFN
ncbi:hypothetical protein [uncultured Christiangramia sp.]|uniref:hypothetical protein n=1 Tax=Christiangramia sp. 3-2217-3z TaxID=3417564 RepID=UPI00261CB9BF|nr:hypothetical protein [uncultured Christiangramia sp.]